MANPIAFQVPAIDPRRELERRLAAAPQEHAEALLVAFDLLEEAHRQGVLDLLYGAVGSKNEIFAKIAEYVKEPVCTQAIRNGITVARLLGSIDPEVLLNVVESLTPPVDAVQQLNPRRKTPSLFTLVRRMNSEDSRRGLDVVTSLLAGLGRSMR